VNAFQLSVPDWISSQKYDIVARVPRGASKEQASHMLQAVLAERLRLVLHHEMKELRGFELSIGRSGSKLNPQPIPACPTFHLPPRPRKLT
jgi:uncharacterized protein (TIGR03435 family)